MIQEEVGVSNWVLGTQLVPCSFTPVPSFWILFFGHWIFITSSKNFPAYDHYQL